MSNFNEYKTKDILPHNPPMVLIDKVIDVNLEEKTLISEINIDENNIFFDKSINGIDSTVGIEFMAQTIGCYAFFKNNCKPPKIGFLLGSRLFNTGIPIFKLNEKYTIKVKEIFTDEQIVAFDCIMYDRKNEEIASATINVFQAENAEEFITNNG